MRNLVQFEEKRGLGSTLRQRRLAAKLTQAVVAAAAGISTSYYSEIENGRCPAPPRPTLKRILCAIGFSLLEARQVERQAAAERGVAPEDWELPEEAQALIVEIRKHAKVMSPRFLRGLRTQIREVVA